MKKTIVITAGGTVEPIDGVRSITNTSTGKLGSVICDEMIELKAEEINKIYYICSKDSIKPMNKEKIEIIEVTDVESVRVVIENLLKTEHIDIFIHSMAVSDYTIDKVTNSRLLAEYLAENIDKSLGKEELVSQINTLIKSNGNTIDTNKKVSSYEDNLIVNLKQTPKIISMIKDLNEKTYLVGFKLLDGVAEDELISVGQRLMSKNKCDLVVANDMKDISGDKHEAILLDRDGNKIYAKTKREIAKGLVKKIFK